MSAVQKRIAILSLNFVAMATIVWAAAKAIAKTPMNRTWRLAIQRTTIQMTRMI
jgi:hypothetical protein